MSRQFGNLTTSKVFVDLKVFQKLAEQPEREWTVSELAKDTGADIQLMGKRVRYDNDPIRADERRAIVALPVSRIQC
jgi:hypothetical protein